MRDRNGCHGCNGVHLVTRGSDRYNGAMEAHPDRNRPDARDGSFLTARVMMGRVDPISWDGGDLLFTSPSEAYGTTTAGATVFFLFFYFLFIFAQRAAPFDTGPVDHVSRKSTLQITSDLHGIR